MTLLPTFSEHYNGGLFAPYVRAHRLAGLVGSIIEVAQPAGDFSDPPVTDMMVVHALSEGISLRSDLGGGRFETRCRAGSLFLVPPETATDILVHNQHSIRVLALPADHLRPYLEEARRPGDSLFDFGRLHAGPFQSPFVLTLMDRLWQESEHNDAPSRLLAEGAILALTAELLREAERPLARTVPVRAGLAPWQVKRVLEYLAGHLAQDVSLGELAAIAGLSSAHFCRAFKQSTGRSPLQQLIAMRTELAKELLSDPRLPIIEIAAACGYESPGAFSQAFKRETGMTPSAWRRERLA